MPIWMWVALGLFVVLSLATGAVAIVALVRLFLTLAALGKALAPVTDRLAAAAEELSLRTEKTALNLARLEQSVAALRASRGELDTLRFGSGDVLRLIRIARTLVPTK